MYVTLCFVLDDHMRVAIENVTTGYMIAVYNRMALRRMTDGLTTRELPKTPSMQGPSWYHEASQRGPMQKEERKPFSPTNKYHWPVGHVFEVAHVGMLLSLPLDSSANDVQ